MNLATLLYYLVMCVANAAILLVFILIYFRKSGNSVQRWFLLYLVNAVGTAMTLALEIAIRAGTSDIFLRIINEVRDITGLANIFLLPFFIHSYLNEKWGRIADLAVFAVALAAIVLSDAGLSLVGAVALSAAAIYTLSLGGYIISKRKPTGSEQAVLKPIIIISAAFFPLILLNIAAGYSLFFSGNVSTLLMTDARPPLFIITALVLLLRLRPEGQEASMVIDSDRLAVLSEREREVAGHLLNGDTNKQIADRLCIAESTVKKHIHSIFGKLDISSRWELVKLRKSPE